jgi:hypothetical protein
MGLLDGLGGALNGLTGGGGGGGGGASGAVDGTLAAGQQSAADSARLNEGMAQIQGEMAASQAKTSIDTAVSRNTAEVAKQIK